MIQQGRAFARSCFGPLDVLCVAAHCAANPVTLTCGKLVSYTLPAVARSGSRETRTDGAARDSSIDGSRLIKATAIIRPREAVECTTISSLFHRGKRSS